MFSAFNPSKCTHTWSSGQLTLRRPGSSWGFGALLKGFTSVMDNSYRSRDSNPQPRITSPTLYPLGHDCPCYCTVTFVTCVFGINDTEHLKCILTFCFLQLSAFLYKTKSSSNQLWMQKSILGQITWQQTPSFLSEGNYVNITEQYKGMCFNLNPIAVPESSSLYPSFTESSQSSQFKNGRLSWRKHNCSPCSFSAEYVNLRHNRLCLPEYLPKRVF